MGDSNEDEPPQYIGSGNKVTPILAVGIPPGLSSLVPLEMIIIKQQIELAEILGGCEGQNKYMIKDQFGRDIFQAKEDSCCCFRQCFGKVRSFGMQIRNLQGMEVIHLERPCRCATCFCCCCLQKIDVFAPPGNLIGTVKQTCTLCKPNFSVKNAMGETVLKIKGPCFTQSCCCNDVEFKLFTPDGQTPVGKISKKWGGLLTEGYTDADNFGIIFPMDLDVLTKATLIGACILIDFMFFEDSGKRQS